MAERPGIPKQEGKDASGASGGSSSLVDQQGRFFGVYPPAAGWAALIAACFLLAFSIPRLEEPSRKTIQAALVFGIAGTIASITVMAAAGPLDTMAAFPLQVITMAGLLGLIALSSYRSR